MCVVSGWWLAAQGVAVSALWFPALREHLHQHRVPVLHQSGSLPGCRLPLKVIFTKTRAAGHKAEEEDRGLVLMTRALSLFLSPGSRLCALWMQRGSLAPSSGWKRSQWVWFSSAIKSWAKTARTNQCASSTTPWGRGSIRSTTTASLSASCSRWPSSQWDHCPVCYYRSITDHSGFPRQL